MLCPLLPAALLAFWLAVPGRCQETPPEPTPRAPSIAAPDDPGAGLIERYRLRLVNRPDGLIQVSVDAGATWQTVGRVTTPATRTTSAPPGIAAASHGSVAVTAVHGFRFRVGNGAAPRVVAVLPREFAGGDGAAGIATDIPAGTSLFRDLAPRVGSPVLLVTASGRPVALPTDYRPGQGETLVIPVQTPANELRTLVLENRAGGAVTATYADGTARRLGRVVAPTLGVGRYDGTAYTGVGRINTSHPGALVISTVAIDARQPEGVGKERRGGFQIALATRRGAAPTSLTLEPLAADETGSAPTGSAGTLPFCGQVSIGFGTVVDCVIDSGDWEPLPALRGAQMDALTGHGLTETWKRQGIARISLQGVTALRLQIPPSLPEELRRRADAAAEQHRRLRLAAARAGKAPIVHGLLSIKASPTNRARVQYVRLLVDGQPRGFTNVAPFILTWDTTRVPDGDYLIEAEALDEQGNLVTTSKRRVYVLNRRGPSP